MSTECCRAGFVKLIFPCSGASDVGEIADHAGRKLTKEGVGRMYCLAGIAGGVSEIVASTKAAGKILVIDGCPSDCARNTLLHAGLDGFDHLRVTDLGFAKGQSPVNNDNVEKVAIEGASALLK